MKELPVLYKDKKECCGCSACEQVCPVKAIKMNSDELGFLYPYIDKEKCLRCQSCLKVCPLKKEKKYKN